jgi:hypothetical protein
VLSYLERPPQPLSTPAGSPPALLPTTRPASTVSTLLPELSTYLMDAAGPGSTVQIIDLGAGTGANQRWLAPRLPIRQRWLHLDHNPMISRSLPLPAEDPTRVLRAMVGRLYSRGSGGLGLASLVGSRWPFGSMR